MSLAARQRAGWFAVMTGDTDFTPGRMDGGFLLLARDLFRAFAVARFNSYQLLLIEQAVEQSYGEAKLRKSADPLPFRISTSDLARATGLNRTHLSEQHARLVKLRVFVKDGGLYHINKDYREWLESPVKAGEPPVFRLDVAAVRWCLDAQKRRPELSVIADNMSVIADTSDVGNRRQHVGDCRHDVGENRQVDTDPKPVFTDARCRYLPTGDVGIYRQVEVVPPGPPIGERTRDRDLKIDLLDLPDGSPPACEAGPATTEAESAKARDQVFALVMDRLADEPLAEAFGKIARDWSLTGRSTTGIVMAFREALDSGVKPRKLAVYVGRSLSDVERDLSTPEVAPASPEGLPRTRPAPQTSGRKSLADIKHEEFLARSAATRAMKARHTHES